MLDTPEDIRRHVGHKLDMHELRNGVGERMLAALDRGAEPDYRALLYAAMWPPPPAVVFHTAPTSAREAIEREGLRVSQPGTGNWAPRPGCVALQADQPVGVYVGPEPDLAGVWSHWPAWDVWAVELRDLPFVDDPINPGHWAITVPVPAAACALV